jgi:hypothetical protein
MKKTFKRPQNDFGITDVKHVTDIVKNHTDAGFEDVPAGLIRDHHIILLNFFTETNLFSESFRAECQDIEAISLYNRHLTDNGYYFMQYIITKWDGQLYRRYTSDKRRGFLKKWFFEWNKEWSDQLPQRKL